MSYFIGNKDKQGNILRIGGWIADLWQTPRGTFFMSLDNDKLEANTEEEAVDLYNEVNNTELGKLMSIPQPKAPRLVFPIRSSVIMSNLVKRVPSSTQPGVFYDVRKLPSGTLTCTCTGYGFRHTCSHCKLVESELKR